jgi:hypothetical protein
MTLQVLITVDTESYTSGSPDEQIWGRLAEGEFGIGWIMDTLERHAAKGTFYVNVYESARHGEKALRDVVREIHRRGHDVQLHTHPKPRFGVTKLYRADLPRQVEIIRWGKDFIEQETGVPVVAHRAGGFSASLETLSALQEVGIPVDASLSAPWFESMLARQVESPNQPFECGPVLELPVTHLVQARIGRWQSLRMVDLEACTFGELKKVVRQAIATRVTSVNVLVHSHSFVRDGRANRALIERFEDLLLFLRGLPGVELSTTSEFLARWKSESLSAVPAGSFTPYTGWWLTYLRSVANAGNGWKNAATAVGAPVALAAIFCGLLEALL